MSRFAKFGLALMSAILFATPSVAQTDQTKQMRRPPAHVSQQAMQSQADPDGSVFVLNGLPLLLELHHDTEVATGNPIDVYMLVIEMQVMNSDGNFEPVGLQIHNFFTAKPLDAKNGGNRHNARDCKLWVGHVNDELRHRDQTSRLWPYIEMLTNTNARVIETNEDGRVWWSDDIQCWGSMDRFRPF